MKSDTLRAFYHRNTHTICFYRFFLSSSNVHRLLVASTIVLLALLSRWNRNTKSRQWNRRCVRCVVLQTALFIPGASFSDVISFRFFPSTTEYWRERRIPKLLLWLYACAPECHRISLNRVRNVTTIESRILTSSVHVHIAVASDEWAWVCLIEWQRDAFNFETISLNK